MNSRDEFRRDMNESLISLLSSIPPNAVDKRNRDLLTEFIDNFEYGVALEWLHSLVKERDIQLSSEQRQAIERLAQQMKIDLS